MFKHNEKSSFFKSKGKVTDFFPFFKPENRKLLCLLLDNYILYII